MHFAVDYEFWTKFGYFNSELVAFHHFSPGNSLGFWNIALPWVFAVFDQISSKLAQMGSGIAFADIRSENFEISIFNGLFSGFSIFPYLAAK